MKSRADATSDFERRVDDQVLAKIFAQPVDFLGLLSSLPSVYPTSVINSIDRLVSAGKISVLQRDELRQQAAKGDTAQTAARNMLPLPHPLEFEWRFCADTAQSLLQLTNDLAPPSTGIVLLGTPGVALEALHLPLARHLTFIGENNVVTKRLMDLSEAAEQSMTLRFCNSVYPQLEAGAVVVDPPWYPDFVRPMLAAAAHSTCIGGFVLVSLPPEGVRPSAVDDQRGVIRFAERIGLRLDAYHPLSLKYETPFFEQNALKVTGIGALNKWRRGDLLIFKKVSRTTPTTELIVSRKREWTEFLIGRMRLLIRRRPVSTGEEGLSSILDGDILPTVSRREGLRRNAAVWTSGNRIFASDNTELVVEAALSLCTSDINGGIRPALWSNTAEAAEVERIADFLKALALQETDEERAFLRSSPVKGDQEWNCASTSSWSEPRQVVSGATT